MTEPLDLDALKRQVDEERCLGPGDFAILVADLREARDKLEMWKKRGSVLAEGLAEACKDQGRILTALAMVVNATEDTMSSPGEAASWARTGDMQGYIDTAKELLAGE